MENRNRIMFAGDIHGEREHLEWVFAQAARSGAKAIIACGDFGYWPHIKWGQQFLDLAEELAAEHGITLYWVDGNHENHDLLDELVALHGAQNPIPVAGPGVLYVPRGCMFTIDGVTLMGFGGAYSVDWKQRRAHVSWWEQELVTREQVDALVPTKVDILVTHEAPLGRMISYKDGIPESVAQRELVQEIEDKVLPALHVCGHHHTRETWTNGDTRVEVLGRDGMDDESVLVLDLAAFATEVTAA
ncbi:MAG: metallophosphoesterase [Acidimicrobiales bacterium]